ncbi:MAG: 23S rRNA (adenine(2503)-C(2))-methyltransferase RlmN [Deltaproteobacteria bacterium]|nr:MAG: 23S rRNA (adenine(2503)-C(2))-methyltransferase RlmN [Deltaproteobacteria bacterium]
MNIFGRTHNQFVGDFRSRYGKGPHYSTAVYRHVMKAGKTFLDTLDVVAGKKDLIASLLADLDFSPIRLVKQMSDQGVIKFISRLADGLDIESVIIPMHRRKTLCVSSQVGCRMGCRFCRTGKMGLIRNLTAAEIVSQVFVARHQIGSKIRNVVFMGMGEPLDNWDNVVQAIRVMSDQRGLDISPRHITLSTAGLTGGINRLAQFDDPSVNLAVSLNAPNDDIRSLIMPINRAMPMASLRQSLMQFPLSRKSAIFIEYVLIKGINDRREHARALARFLAPINAVKVNLIPYNPEPGSEFNPPSAEAYEQFHAWLVAEKVFVRRRSEKGARIMAACGQLGLPIRPPDMPLRGNGDPKES